MRCAEFMPRPKAQGTGPGVIMAGTTLPQMTVIARPPKVNSIGKIVSKIRHILKNWLASLPLFFLVLFPGPEPRFPFVDDLCRSFGKC